MNTKMLKKLDKDFYTIKDICKITGYRTQTLYMAISKNRLQYFINKQNKRCIKTQDFIDYIRSLYSRKFLTNEFGKKIYDESKNLYSVKQISEILNISVSKIYYGIYNGNIPYEKSGTQYVLHVPNPLKFKETHSLKYAKRKRRKVSV